MVYILHMHTHNFSLIREICTNDYQNHTQSVERVLRCECDYIEVRIESEMVKNK